MTTKDGVPVEIRYQIDYVSEFRLVNKGQPLAPGQSDTPRQDALYASSCLHHIGYKIAETLPGCTNGNKAGVWITRYHNWCNNTMFSIKRDGCNVVLESR